MQEEVAGSPYWMAPEVIEMRGKLTTACDVWCVATTVIDLNAGKPSNSSIIRIVQDDHQPFPWKLKKKR